ncbi:hypothetical protein ACLOJK_021971, partial [Asimina triloba]
RKSSPSLPPFLWRVTVDQVRDLLLSSSLSLSPSLLIPPPPSFSISRPPPSLSLSRSFSGSPPSLSVSIPPVPIPSPLPSRPLLSLSPCLSFSARPSSLSRRLDPSCFDRLTPPVGSAASKIAPLLQHSKTQSTNIHSSADACLSIDFLPQATSSIKTPKANALCHCWPCLFCLAPVQDSQMFLPHG